MTEKVAEGADAFLERYPQDARDLELMREDPATWLRREVQNLQKMSRDQHVKHLALTYTMYAKAAQDDGYRKALVGLLAARRKKVTKQTHFADLLVELMFTYGDDTPENRSRYRRLYNRDAHAIRYLMAAKIPPDQVEELARQKGEGPDAWSRKRADAEARSESAAIDEASQQDCEASPAQVRLRASGPLNIACTLAGTDTMAEIVERAIDLLKHVSQHVSDAGQAASGMNQDAKERVQIARHKCRILTELCERALSIPDEPPPAILEVEMDDDGLAEVLNMSKEDRARITVKRRKGPDGWTRIIAVAHRIHVPSRE
ncbi:hypothetical protein AA309_05380 [Microvirga vignae]|uniref:Uncharacterized protein n=1 Tax=Microvirga vignae TaxID=1225564 RepID=A0A0H1RMQ2_9HYPH|nr:hypothetical protein AA309_05380 [Microvirga vignae]